MDHTYRELLAGRIEAGMSATSVPSAADTADTADGRHARRERNRLAVVDAMLSLYQEGTSASPVSQDKGPALNSIFPPMRPVATMRTPSIRR